MSYLSDLKAKTRAKLTAGGYTKSVTNMSVADKPQVSTPSVPSVPSTPSSTISNFSNSQSSQPRPSTSPAPTPKTTPAPIPSVPSTPSSTISNFSNSQSGVLPSPTTAPPVVSTPLPDVTSTAPVVTNTPSATNTSETSSGTGPPPSDSDVLPPVVPEVPEVPEVPTQEEKTIELRETLEAAGIKIDNIGNVPTINGVEVDPASAGMTLINGRWQGTPSQIATLIGKPVGVREALEATGRKVEYDPNSGLIYVDGIQIRTDEMTNINGRLYTTEDYLNKIISETGGEKPLGGEDIPTEEENKLQQEKDNAELEELRALVDEIRDYKIPEYDSSVMLAFLKELQDYKSPYDDAIKQVLQQTFAEFDYDVDNDPLLDDAIKYADRSMMEEMNRRGILSSTMTKDNMITIRKELMPQYQDMAYQRYNEKLNMSFKRLDALNSLSNTDYERYKGFITLAMETSDKISENTYKVYKDNLMLMQGSLENQLAMQKLEAETKATEYKKAWDKFKEIGYVDREISLATGLQIGTRSKEAEDEILARYDEYNKLAIQANNRKDELDYKHKLDMEEAKELKKEKDIIETRKTNAAKLYANLASMSPTDALDNISKNFATLADYLGSELYTVIDDLKKQKETEDKATATKKQNEISNNMEQQRINISREKKDSTSGSKSLSTVEKNKWIAENALVYQSYPVETAIKYMIEDYAEIVTKVGTSGYEDVWNKALEKAIKAEQALNYKDYYKAPKKSETKGNDIAQDALDKYLN